MFKSTVILTLIMLAAPAAADELQDLKKMFAMQKAEIQAMIPAGTIAAFGGSTPPKGWKFCDGSALSSSEYPLLFQAIGTAWGKPSEGRFNLPDLRGRFLRGVDGGVNRDLDRDARIASAPGGNAGDRVGSSQDDETATNALANEASSVSGRIFGGAHIHKYNGVGAHPWNGPGSQNGHIVTMANFTAKLDASVSAESSDHEHSFELSAAAQKIKGGNETRPVNANVQYIIKY